MTVREKLPLAPSKITIQGPYKGQYKVFSAEEQYKYIFDVADIRMSVIVDEETSDYIESVDWPEKLERLIRESKKWHSSESSNADRDALYEWITRDDEDEERLCAIEVAQMDSAVEGLLRTIRRHELAVINRVTAILSAPPADSEMEIGS